MCNGEISCPVCSENGLPALATSLPATVMAGLELPVAWPPTLLLGQRIRPLWGYVSCHFDATLGICQLPRGCQIPLLLPTASLSTAASSSAQSAGGACRGRGGRPCLLPACSAEPVLKRAMQAEANMGSSSFCLDSGCGWSRITVSQPVTCPRTRWW